MAESQLPFSVLPGGTVTFLFTDIEGSTDILEKLSDQYPQLLKKHREILNHAIENWKGQVVDSRGEEFFIAFPRASDAVAAAVEAQKELDAYPWPAGAEVRVRMGLHTGEPLVADAGYVGIDVHRAARIGNIGHGGQILLSETTASLVRHELPEEIRLLYLGSHKLKGVSTPEPISQISILGLTSEFPPLDSQEAAPLAIKRWRTNRVAIGSQTLRAGIGAGISLAIYGLGLPFFVALAFPTEFQDTLELVSLPGWMLGGAVIGLFIGLLQGVLTGFILGLADALWHGSPQTRWILGTASGLFHSAYLILFTAAGLFDPPSDAIVNMPVNLLYGLLVGLALTYVVPVLGKGSTFQRQLTLSTRAATALAAVTIPYVLLVYQQDAAVTYLSRIVYAVLLPIGVGLSLASKGSGSDPNR